MVVRVPSSIPAGVGTAVGVTGLAIWVSVVLSKGSGVSSPPASGGLNSGSPTSTMLAVAVATVARGVGAEVLSQAARSSRHRKENAKKQARPPDRNRRTRLITP